MSFNFCIFILKDSTSTTAKHDGSQKDKKNTHHEYENFDLRDPTVAQNGDNGNRIVINISEHLQLETLAVKYLRLVF